MRISISLADKIARQMIEAQFGERAGAQVKTDAWMANYCWRAHADEELLRAADAAPRGLLPVVAYYDATAPSGERWTLHFDGAPIGVLYEVGARAQNPQRVAMPACYTSSPGVRVTRDFADRLRDLAHTRQKLMEEISDARRAAKQAVLQFSTLERALKAWPEAAVFIEPYLTDPQAGRKALAIPLERVNALLGLPPETK